MLCGSSDCVCFFKLVVFLGFVAWTVVLSVIGSGISSNSKVDMILQLIGWAAVLVTAWRIGVQIFKGIQCYVMKRNVDFAAFGKWAVVTGSTGGMGEAFVDEFAARGLDVYMLGRSEEKLAELRERMAGKHPTRQFSTLRIDFNTDTNIQAKVVSALGNLDIGVLVNNAGRADDLPGYFHDMNVDLGMEMININVRATSVMCHSVLGGMKRRQRGAIINVSSFAAINVCPQMSLYSATKSYTIHLTKTLDSEYAQHGVKFQCLTPSFVQTKMAGAYLDTSQPNALMPAPEKYVQAALNTFGVSMQSSGYPLHSLFSWIIYLLPCQMARKAGDQKMDEMIAFARKKQGLPETSSHDGNVNGFANGVERNGVSSNGHGCTAPASVANGGGTLHRGAAGSGDDESLVRQRLQ